MKRFVVRIFESYGYVYTKELFALSRDSLMRELDNNSDIEFFTILSEE